MRLLMTLCTVLLFSTGSIGIPFVPSSNGHNCAPATPPPVSGSPVQAPATAHTLFINEVLTVPQSTWNCSEVGTYFSTKDIWIELYNPQNGPLDLYASHATIDSGDSNHAFYVPFGTAIAPHGYLVLFPYTSATFLPTATFRLMIAGVVIDQVNVPTLGGDQSYARTTDGGSSWQITSAPTIDATNTVTATVTPTVTASTASSSSSSSGSSGGGSSTPTSRSIVNGIQPNWNKLQIPATPTANQPYTPSLRTGTIAPVTNTQLDTLQRILLTVLAIALSGVLCWCWWLFMPQYFPLPLKKKKENPSHAPLDTQTPA